MYFEELMNLQNTLDKAKDKGVREKILEEMKQILSQIRFTLHSVKNPNEKASFMKRSRIYQDRVNSEELIQNQTSNVKSENSESHESSLQMLNIARNQLLECEEVASNTLNTLHEQRESLQQVKNKLKQTDNDLKQSGGMISKMGSWFRG